ncbi:hypothetical protein KY285_037986 [Solanum tuberosum]|nr:hypothetical protein KY285_037986 [Solanum tuberosum]
MNTQFVVGESSSSSFSYLSYDVFVSFRGEDTRKNFTGHLYFRLCRVGVNTFIDDEELRKGDVISIELEKAIEESRVAIVVFSKNYASSSWCLDELVKILDCRERLNQVVLPIFYNVDPSQVRKQNGSFGEALEKHKERLVGAERMEKWRAALTEAANLSGWDLRNVADGHESKFIESIIKQVLQEINQTPLDVAQYPIGLDSPIKHIEVLLQSGGEHEVRMVGICGVGGIGKTTLAKAIYNRIFQQFDGSCFLSDIRSKTKESGLIKLQEKLLNQILKTKEFEVDSVAEGVNLIKARLGSQKVLIVLDDVDHRSQLESLTRERSWFGSGSVIIITTRDEHLLYGLTTSEIYRAKLLNDKEAHQLFSCHAFKCFSPPQEYVELAQDIIKYSGGLPLALVTLGSHLQGRSVKEWRDEFKKLKAIPHADIQKILKISFDGLDVNTQSVFLDIACVFHGCRVDEVAKTLNACGFYFESAISTLVQRNLLQRNCPSLVMHGLVQEMGKEIIRMESQDPGKRSRLFNPLEAIDVLLGNKGSKKVEILVVERQALKGVNLSTEAFRKMKNLRVLKIDDLHISGDFELLSKELRWLSWEGCPLKCIPSNFPSEKLVFLNMKGSNIQEFGLNLQYCRNLKKLDLSDCKRLRRTPNFKGSRSLEKLLLMNCSSLKEIHPSIGNLDRLTGLTLYGCEKITDLPSSICQLKSLRILVITDCSSLQTLPVDIGDMQRLSQLKARRTGIRELPGSVEMLKLLELEIGGLYLGAKRRFSQTRVHPVVSLSKFISILCLSYCGFSEGDVPRNIGSLSNLVHLDLSGNNFLYLPFDFSNLPLLVCLFLNDCENLQTLPSISNLEYFKTLELKNCQKLVKITGLDNLPSIKRMDMINCTRLQNPFNEGFFSAHALSISSREHSVYELSLQINLESNEIPDWCSNKVTAPSICLTMPTVHNNKFLGMVLWFVCRLCDVDEPEHFAVTVAHIKRSGLPWYHAYFDRSDSHYVSCVYYFSYSNDTPFKGLNIKGGEQITVENETGRVTVKKIGIHLLYLDRHGNVTSLPGVVDHSYTPSYPQRLSAGHINSNNDNISNEILQVRHESKFIESIVKHVLQEVNQTPLDVAWHPVGVDSRVEDIELLLQKGCVDEVRMAGIYGVGGIGKTTLAKAIYNQIFRQFDSSCFLSDVRSEVEAFGLVNPSPPQEYVELAQSIIKYSGGLPLALVTLGSHLQGRSVEEWRYEFKKLRAIPHCDIQKILKISFDGLDCDTQSVFLDIACAFHGFFEDEVIKTLNACGFYSESAISTLVQRNLLQRDWRYLVMHDLVRDMGREIVRMESPRDSGKRSRLFKPQEVRDVLQGNKGSEKVEVLMIDPGALKGANLSTKTFKKMKNLRVLKIDELHINGDFELLSKELRWLSWQKCPLKCIPSYFPAEKLVVLKMQGSNIQEFGADLKCCKSLKKLDLSDSKSLVRTPNFNGSRSLETLWLRGCTSLTEIHQSIGNLHRLIDLDFYGCKKLTYLPSSICHLKSLRSLGIRWCSSLQTLPVELGEMQGLTSLLASDTGIIHLPGSVEMLKDLVTLEVGSRNLEAKRSIISRKRIHRVESLSSSISSLILTYCGFSEADIPRDIGSLSSLIYLNLSGNSFLCLPFDFSKLRLLEYLCLNDCENLQTLPSVSNLEKLWTFEIANSKKLVDVTGLDNLPFIERINMVNCTSLQNPFNEGFFSAPALPFQSRKNPNPVSLSLYLSLVELISQTITFPL